MSQDGVVIRIPVAGVRTMGRNTMGVRVMNLRGEDRVASMARVVRGATVSPDEDAEAANGDVDVLAAPVADFDDAGDPANEGDYEDDAGFDPEDALDDE